MQATNWQDQLIQDVKTTLLINEPMSRHTYFQIGGCADVYAIPHSIEVLQQIVKWCVAYAVPYVVIGNGTNLLVSDKGIRGVVLAIDSQLSSIEVSPPFIKAQAGALLSQVAQEAMQYALAGFEFAAGIPGSIGGAVFMNAGAYDGEMRDVVESVDVVTRRGELETWDAKRLALSYRHSAISDEGAIVAQVLLKLQAGNQQDISAEINKLNRWRRERQPLQMPSAGSTFKRPPGTAGSYLIDQAGLKGKCIGGAQVSQKHAGFIVNTGGATAQDVLDLMAFVQQEVLKQFGILLEPEVRFMGEPQKSDLLFAQKKK